MELNTKELNTKGYLNQSWKAFQVVTEETWWSSLIEITPINTDGVHESPYQTAPNLRLMWVNMISSFSNMESPRDCHPRNTDLHIGTSKWIDTCIIRYRGLIDTETRQILGLIGPWPGSSWVARLYSRFRQCITCSPVTTGNLGTTRSLVWYGVYTLLRGRRNQAWSIFGCIFLNRMES